MYLRRAADVGSYLRPDGRVALQAVKGQLCHELLPCNKESLKFILWTKTQLILRARKELKQLQLNWKRIFLLSITFLFHSFL